MATTRAVASTLRYRFMMMRLEAPAMALQTYPYPSFPEFKEGQTPLPGSTSGWGCQAPDGVLSRCSRSAATTQHADFHSASESHQTYACRHAFEAGTVSSSDSKDIGRNSVLALMGKGVIMARMPGRPLTGLRVVFIGQEGNVFGIYGGRQGRKCAT